MKNPEGNAREPVRCRISMPAKACHNKEFVKEKENDSDTRYLDLPCLNKTARIQAYMLSTYVSVSN